MEKTNKTHRPRCMSHTMIACSNGTKTYIHPTLFRKQIQEIDQQINSLACQLQREDDRCCRIGGVSREIWLNEERITLKMSLLYERQSRLFLEFGRRIEAMYKIMQACTSLFSGHCYILNSVMGLGHPHVDRFYRLNDTCLDLCNRWPELRVAYDNSGMHYLLEEQRLWPCE